MGTRGIVQSQGLHHLGSSLSSSLQHAQQGQTLGRRHQERGAPTANQPNLPACLATGWPHLPLNTAWLRKAIT
jgi:hypothetical protein